MAKDNLRPCPLCGGEVEVVPWESGEQGRHDVVVKCKGCGFEGGPSDEADIVILNWNERSSEPVHQVCPLCGGAPVLDEGKGRIFVQCADCGAEVGVLIGNYLSLGEDAWSVAARECWARWDSRK